ncbi:hypothetical protein G6F32_017419 [Rhizopus arrhizus]|nr:hypothetical protein G6F32_017419 [Rhizopus arrhizus]
MRPAPAGKSKPSENDTMHKDSKVQPSTSKGATSDNASSGKYLRTANKPAMPIGTLIMKIQCQLATWTSRPPKVGPKIGPT